MASICDETHYSLFFVRRNLYLSNLMWIFSISQMNEAFAEVGGVPHLPLCYSAAGWCSPATVKAGVLVAAAFSQAEGCSVHCYNLMEQVGMDNFAFL
jgi:hypothetical protein